MVKIQNISEIHPTLGFSVLFWKDSQCLRNEIAFRFDIDSLQVVLASHWKSYLDSLQVCITDDATCVFLRI